MEGAEVEAHLVLSRQPGRQEAGGDQLREREGLTLDGISVQIQGLHRRAKGPLVPGITVVSF